jgi:hypothetical protein
MTSQYSLSSRSTASEGTAEVMVSKSCGVAGGMLGGGRHGRWKERKKERKNYARLQACVKGALNQ